MANNGTLRKIFVDELRDVYYAEKQLTKALPKLAKAATSPDLREAFQTHLEETEGHVERLEEIFQLLGESAKAKKCPGILGIIEEGAELIEKEPKSTALDAGLIAGAQRAEHYEMAVYGSLVAWAQTLNEDKVAKRLEQTLAEEKAADRKLSALAEDGINSAAAMGDEEEDEEPVRPRRSSTSARSVGMRAKSARMER
jgi:ferritin-like metal-binding protein YciE